MRTKTRAWTATLIANKHEWDFQNYGPFLGPYYTTGPNTGPNLGDPKRDHNFDNLPHEWEVQENCTGHKYI